MRKLLLTPVLLLALAAPASAGDRYVDDSGQNNLSTCTNATAPCRTIAYALTQAGAGDTIHIGGGTYGEAVLLADGKSVVAGNFNAPATAGAAIVDGSAGTAIQSSTSGQIKGLRLRGDTNGLLVSAGTPTVTNVVFDDPSPNPTGRMRVTGGGPAKVVDSTFTGTGAVTSDWGVYLSGSGTAQVSNSKFTALSHALIGIGGFTSLEATGNDIEIDGATGLNVGAGLLMVDGPLVATGNTIKAGGAGNTNGIYLADSRGTLRRNRVTGASRTGVEAHAATKPIVLEGNVIADSAGYGVGISALSGPFTLSGNTIVGNERAIRFSGGTLTVDSTIVDAGAIEPSGGGVCEIAFSRGPTTAGSSCQTFQTAAAPGFVGAGDYRLAAGSPLIDAGNPAAPAAGATDLAGLARALDGDGDCTPRRDIGAYETAAKACSPAAKQAAPRLSGLRIAKRVRRGRRSVVRFKLDRAAKVTLRFERLLKRGKRKLVLRKAVRGKAGANKVRLPARIKRQKLRIGGYRVTAVATADGLRSPLSTRKFRVIRR
jgi:hypothetical protein